MNPLIVTMHGGVSTTARQPGVFRRFSTRIAKALGTPWAFAVAVVFVLAWGGTGPRFHYSDTWQLIVNTVTSVVTFLMVFLIQNTQNREATALHLKLDELIRAVAGARNQLVRLEDLDDEELERLEEEFRRLRQRAERKQQL